MPEFKTGNFVRWKFNSFNSVIEREGRIYGVVVPKEEYHHPNAVAIKFQDGATLVIDNSNLELISEDEWKASQVVNG